MDRKLLNEVNFKKDVKLKEPEVQTEIERDPDRGPRIFAKLMRLVFFIAVLTALWFGGKYFVESFVSFCRGTEHMEMREIKKDFKDYMENR